MGTVFKALIIALKNVSAVCMFVVVVVVAAEILCSTNRNALHLHCGLH